jgi:hypothetical protein
MNKIMGLRTMKTNNMMIEAEAYRHCKREIEILLNVVDAYKSE